MGKGRWYGWWYLSIALGFALLAARQALIDGSLSGILVRIVIAAGFTALGAAHLRRKL